MMEQVTYNPGVYDVASLEQARQIILTTEDRSSEERWEKETPYLGDLIHRTLQPGADDLIIDHGCGIGRLSREIIQRSGCWVLGTDISQSMRVFATNIMGTDRFAACTPGMLDQLIARGVRADAVCSAWVLQLCFDLDAEIARLHTALKPGGRLFVVSSKFRTVPTVEKTWVDDGVDVAALLARQFTVLEEGSLDPDQTTPMLAKNAFWACYQKR